MYRSSCYTKQMGYPLTPIPTPSRLSSSCASYTKPAPPLHSLSTPPPSPTSPARPTLTASISSSYTRPHFHPLMAFSSASFPRTPPPYVSFLVSLLRLPLSSSRSTSHSHCFFSSRRLPPLRPEAGGEVTQMPFGEAELKPGRLNYTHKDARL